MYLVVFAQSFSDFRLPEFTSMCDLHQMKVKILDYSADSPFCLIDAMDKHQITTIVERCVLVQSVIEIWGSFTSRKELCEFSFSGIPVSSMSFNILLHSYGRKVPLAEKISLIEDIKYLPLSGSVDCKAPEKTYYICEEYTPKTFSPKRVFFGLLVATGNRHTIHKFNLKKRLYIGRTSMDPELGLIMTNLGQVKRGDLVYDPFLGTGSLAIPASYYGAFTAGADLDMKALRGWGKSTKKGEGEYDSRQSVHGNMQFYGIQKRFLGCHCSNFAEDLIREEDIFDAIITDPPYGVREAALKSHKPSTVGTSQFSLSAQFVQLLNFAVNTLVVGGRLVFWIPIIRASYSEETLPAHPCLTLVYNCEQILNKRTSRRLLVMKKTRGAASESDIAFVPSGPDSLESFRDVYFSLDNP